MFESGYNSGVLASSLSDVGYVFVQATATRTAIAACGSIEDWTAFAASWDELEVDGYLTESNRYRTRRFAVYTVAGGEIVREAHQPHYQHRDYNALFGGIERWFAPVADTVGSGPTMTAVLRFCAQTFGALAPSIACWRVEVHQFRIEARSDAPGQPTPEGVHRDGVDFVLVLLVSRENIVSGTTTVYDLGGAPLGSFTLTDPFDAALVDDARVAHGVTPVSPLDPARPAHRDVLVVTFRRYNA